MSLFTSSLDTVPTSKPPKMNPKTDESFAASLEKAGAYALAVAEDSKRPLSPRILKEGSKAQDFPDIVF